MKERLKRDLIGVCVVLFVAAFFFLLVLSAGRNSTIALVLPILVFLAAGTIFAVAAILFVYKLMKNYASTPDVSKREGVKEQREAEMHKFYASKKK